jgi:hypothetical protein
MVSPFPKTDSITREQYEARRGTGDHAEMVVSNPCAICGAELPEPRLRQRAKTCGAECHRKYRAVGQRLTEARRGPRRKAVALELRSAGPAPQDHPPDRLTALVLEDGRSELMLRQPSSSTYRGRLGVR